MGGEFCEKGGVDAKVGEDIKEIDADRSANRVSTGHAIEILIPIDLRDSDCIPFFDDPKRGRLTLQEETPIQLPP